MKKFFAYFIAFTSFGLYASAQTQKPNDANPGTAQRTERRNQNDRLNPRLIDQLTLTSTQKEQIKGFNDEYRAKMQEMIKSEIPVEERKSKRNAFDAEKKNKILSILTADQAKKLKELQSNSNTTNDTGEYKEKIKIDGEKTKIKVKTD